MAIRATSNFDGSEDETNTEAAQLPVAGGGTKSSNDYRSTTSIEVQRGFSKASVSSAADLQDNDIVTVDGIDIKASMARDMGLLGEVFSPIKSPDQLDPGLNSGAAAQNQQQQSDQGTGADTGTGNAAYDEAAAGLNEALEAGTMELAEAQAYDTTMAQMAMANINVDDAVNTLSELSAGTVSELDIGSENATMLRDAETKVTEASTKSAMSELGQEGFNDIQRAAQVDPEVNAAVRNYAVMRASGKTDGLTWADLAADIQEHLGR